MLIYTTRRIAAMIPLLVAVATITFFLMQIVQGGPFDGERPISDATRKNLEAVRELNLVRDFTSLWNLILKNHSSGLGFFFSEMP